MLEHYNSYFVKFTTQRNLWCNWFNLFLPASFPAQMMQFLHPRTQRMTTEQDGERA